MIGKFKSESLTAAGLSVLLAILLSACSQPTEEAAEEKIAAVVALTADPANNAVIPRTADELKAALQVMDMSRSPVIASHSNVQALSNVSRNLSDEGIDRIGASGGVTHVAPLRGYLFNSADPAMDANIRSARRDAGVKEDYLYPFELYWEIDDPEAQAKFLGAVSELIGPESLDDMLDHLDYIVKRIGVDHVGIGTDFNHGSEIPGLRDASEALNVRICNFFPG
ncbi:MAG: membrane dipeptidase [Pseudomonadales bacterium]